MGFATFGLPAHQIEPPTRGFSISLALGGIEVNRVLIFRSLLTTVIGAVVIITMAFFVSEMIGWKLAGSELIARMNPSLLDLGSEFLVTDGLPLSRI